MNFQASKCAVLSNCLHIALPLEEEVRKLMAKFLHHTVLMEYLLSR